VREGVPVRDVLLEGGTVAGVLAEEAGERRLVRAGVVVGADGRRSVVGRRLALLHEHRSLRRFAVRGHWEGMQGLADYGEMHVAAGGYCGVAPLPGGAANVAFVLERRALAPAAGDLEGFYRGTLRRLWPRLAERLDQARLLEPPRAVGPLALECRSAAAPGAVLVGDAAGFYDPFTGEGVTLALRTAEMAAAAVLRALDSPGASVPFLAGYERARRAATRDKFRFNRLLQLAVSSRHVADAVARRLARRPDLADRLVGVAGDFEPARALVSPRVVWDLLTA
jgi:flavin-dependent dehydrogenase